MRLLKRKTKLVPLLGSLLMVCPAANAQTGAYYPSGPTIQSGPFVVSTEPLTGTGLETPFGISVEYATEADYRVRMAWVELCATDIPACESAKQTFKLAVWDGVDNAIPPASLAVNSLAAAAPGLSPNITQNGTDTSD